MRSTRKKENFRCRTSSWKHQPRGWGIRQGAVEDVLPIEKSLKSVMRIECCEEVGTSAPRESLKEAGCYLDCSNSP